MAVISEKEYQLLVNEFASLLLDENMHLRDSMNRIELLLKDAIDLINESVLSAHSSIQTHQYILDSVTRNVDDEQSTKATKCDNNSGPGENLLLTLRKALGITIQLNSILAKTTRSLQVEDIVTQIVKEVAKRSLELDDIFRKIKHDSLDSPLTQSDIKEILRRFEELRVSVHRNPIKQSSLDEGSIELF